MANDITLDGGGKVSDVETGKFQFLGDGTSVVIETGLSRITNYTLSPVAAAAADETKVTAETTDLLTRLPMLFAGTTLTGTATGSSHGILMAGTSATFVRPGTVTGDTDLWFFYRLEGQS